MNTLTFWIKLLVRLFWPLVVNVMHTLCHVYCLLCKLQPDYHDKVSLCLTCSSVYLMVGSLPLQDSLFCVEDVDNNYDNYSMLAHAVLFLRFLSFFPWT